MKNYDEIANSIFARRDEYIANQKKKKRIIASIVTPVVCFCVVLIAGLGLWNNSFFDNNIPAVDNPQTEDPSPNNTPINPPVTETNYFIDSIDKINFYSAKKIIDEYSLFPAGMKGNDKFHIVSLSNQYAEYPIDRNKVFTTTMVTYFTIELNDGDGFLAQKLGGTGLVEVVVTENNIEDMGQMITFKKDEKYYTCFMNGGDYDPDSNKSSIEFSSHKYISGFSIVKNMEQENYKFTVHYDGLKVVGFACAPFHSVPANYAVDDVTFIEDFCAVFYTNRTFTIDELEIYFQNENEGYALLPHDQMES